MCNIVIIIVEIVFSDFSANDLYSFQPLIMSDKISALIIYTSEELGNTQTYKMTDKLSFTLE